MKLAKFFFIMVFCTCCTFSLLSAVEKLVKIDKAELRDLNQFEKLGFPIYYQSDNQFFVSVVNTQVLVQEKIPFQVISENRTYAPIYLISSKTKKPLVSMEEGPRLLYRGKDFLLIQGAISDLSWFWKHDMQTLELTGFTFFKNINTYCPPNFRLNSNRSVNQAVLNQVNADSLAWFDQHLQNFQTRYALAANHREVAKWIKAQFVRFGYTDVVLDSFFIIYQGYQTTQYNVVCTLPGSELPSQYVILGGHHDSITNEDPFMIAPGADDNGSGASAALETARAMKAANYQPKTSIRFITFAMEEFGLYGGKDYATKADLADLDIRAMVNNDMIASQISDNWRSNIQPYTDCDFLKDMAIAMTEDYTSITPLVGSYNSAGSDSNPFWMHGFPAIFLAEYEFSPVYHTPQDLTSACNFPYAAEMVKASAAMVMNLSSLPSKPSNFIVQDGGSGQSLYAHWTAIPDQDISNYQITVIGVNDNVNVTLQITETQINITGLTQGHTYRVSLAAKNTANDLSILQERIAVPLLIPRVVSNFRLEPLPNALLLQWSPNSEFDIVSYKIYRASSQDGNYSVIATINASDSTYNDNAVSNGEFYYYKLTAIDNANYESDPTEVIRGRAVTLNHGILVIDDSFNGDGSLLYPSDEQVDAYYDALLSNFQHTQIDINYATMLDLNDLCAYSTVLYHKTASNNVYPLQFIEAIKKYLDYGGNLLITGVKNARVFDGVSYYPYNAAEGDFFHDYLKIAQADLQNTARFQYAQSVVYSPFYPTLTVDLSKMLASNDNRLRFIESYTATEEGEPIYTYGSGYTSPDPEASMNDLPVAVFYFGEDFKTATFSFPFYMMQLEQTKQLVEYLLHDKFGELVDNHDPTSNNTATAELMANYPNPFNPTTNIQFNLKKQAYVELSIFNAKGQKLRTLQEGILGIGKHTLTWDGSDSSFSKVGSGIYLYQLKVDGITIDCRKMVLLK